VCAWSVGTGSRSSGVVLVLVVVLVLERAISAQHFEAAVDCSSRKLIRSKHCFVAAPIDDEYEDDMRRSRELILAGPDDKVADPV
jgi:hypothetical protein